MSHKEQALNAIRNLPDGVTLQQISETVAFLAAIEDGLNQIERGETVSHADVKRELARWLHE